ncbi:MAG: SusC/RagA family TonB-linked outer membrane protein [Chitinophagaceae bacterium]
MRKTASMLAVLMLFAALAFGQARNVTGKVTDDQGNAVPLASVTIKGTSQGTVADQNGTFIIKVNTGDVLVISSQGFTAKEITVGSGASVSLSLEKAAESLVEVIVSSGYNTKKTQRSLTSNAQVVNAEQLNTIRQPNINNAIAGKVAGAQVRSQSTAALGRDANVRLRGDGTLGGQTLLYIVDGTPTNSVDINPDDVEDLTVLNGPSGAAIYGPQAADGAIVITTKRAKKGQKGIGVEVNSGVTVDKIYILPNYQNEYAGGGVSDLIQYKWVAGQPEAWKALDGKYYHDYTDDASWGPRMTGQEYIPWYAWYPGTQYSFKTQPLVAQPNNTRDFYNTGITTTNNINFSKAGDNFSTRISYTNLDIQGLIPNSYLRRNTFAGNFSIDLGTHFTMSTNLNYVTQNQQAENSDGYGNNSTGSFNSWFHRDLDMNILRELKGMTSPAGSTGTPGVIGSWNHSNPGSYSAANPVNFYGANYWYNPYTYFDNQENLFRRDRLFGDVSLTYKINSDFRLRGSYRKSLVNTWTENRTWYVLERSARQTGLRAGYATAESFFADDRYELVGTYNKKFGDFGLDVLGGGEIVKITNKGINANTRDGLYIPDFFALNNSLSPVAYGNSRSLEKRRALFTRVSGSWRNMLFLDATVRNDWYSTLPAADNGIFVKSFGAGFVFSDLTKDALPFLSYGKLRATWGEVPQAIGPYNLDLAYSVGADQWVQGNPAVSYFVQGTPNGLVSSSIRGATQTTKELGLDLRFLKNRAGISATYYAATTENSPISVTVSGASGFGSQTINAGEISRKGLEFQAFGRPVVSKDFSWDINATYAKVLSNKVVSLAPGVSQITLSSGAGFNGITPPFTVHQEGQPWGMLIGGGKTYVDGKPVLDEDGNYVKSENVKFGSVLPDYTGGLQNTFSYKNIVLNINIDFQVGGKFFSMSDMWGSYSGLTARTAGNNDKGNPIRDAVADGGGIHVVGVDADKNPVDMYVEAQDYFHNMVGNNVFDEFVYDLTYVKMREVSLGYRIPVQKWGFTSKWLQNATFSVIARNPWMIYRKSKDFDPSEISSVFGENGQFPGTRSLGVNLKLGF